MSAFRINDQHIEEILWSSISGSRCSEDFLAYLAQELDDASHNDEARRFVVAFADGPNQRTPEAFLSALEKIEVLAMSGDTVAMFHMGVNCAKGTGGTLDPEKAKSWFEKAIEGGQVRAYDRLAGMYLRGDGVEKDERKAIDLLETASALGEYRASTHLGKILARESGGISDPNRGVKLLEQAFNGGYPAAGVVLAELLIEGAAISKDVEAGFSWLEKVCEVDPPCLTVLGRYLITGEKGPRDFERGCATLAKAFDAGFHYVAEWLGRAFEEGSLVDRDIVKARTWYQAGCDKGMPGCMLRL